MKFLLFLCTTLACAAQTLYVGTANVGTLTQQTSGGGGGGGGSPAVEASGNSNWIYTAFFSSTNKTTCGGQNRLLIVTVGVGDASRDTVAPTNITYAGQSLTKLWATNGPTWIRNDLWYLINPNTGENDLIVSWAEWPDQVCVGWINVTNAHQSSPFGTAATASGTGTGPTVDVSSASGRLVVSSISTDSEASLSASTGASVWTVLNVDTDTAYGMSTNAGAASVSMTWTTASASYALGGIGISPP